MQLSISKKMIGGGTLIGLIIGMGIWYGIDTLRDHQYNERADAIATRVSTFIFPDIEFKERIYRVHKHRVVQNDNTSVENMVRAHVLGIAYFSGYIRTSAPFVLEGTDLTALTQSVADLESSVSDFAQFYPTQEAAALNSYFYPTDFLTALQALEEKRRVLIYAPSDTKIHAYMQQLTTTVRLYREHIAGLMRIYGDMYDAGEAHGEQKRFHSIGGYTNPERILRTLSEMDANAVAQLAHARNVWECATLVGDACPELSWERGDSDTDTPNDISYDVSIPDTIHTNKMIHDAYYRLSPQTVDRSLEQPIVTLSNTTCFWEYAPAYIATPVRELGPGRYAEKTIFLNKLFFYDTAQATSSGNTYLQSAYEKGLDYAYQPLANTYMCFLGIVADSAHAVTAQSITQYVKRDPIFDRATSSADEDIRHLADMERHIRSADAVIDAAYVAAYARGIEALLASKSEYALTEELDRGSVIAMERIRNFQNAKTAAFANRIQTIVEENSFIHAFIESEARRIPYDTLFITRSAFDLLLLTFNETIHPALLDPKIKETTNLHMFDLTSYAENALFRDAYDIDTLPALMYESKRYQEPF